MCPRRIGEIPSKSLQLLRDSLSDFLGCVGAHGLHLTRLRPNFSVYLVYRLQKDAALHRNDHDRVGLYRREYKSRRNWNSFDVQRLMITNDDGCATSVIRALDLAIQIPGLLEVAEPLVVWVFRKENVRILAELKRYVEAQPKQRDL